MKNIPFAVCLIGLLAAGCVSRGDAVKDVVKTRYDSFAKSGGKACEE
jgi:hypothetical protein